MDNQYKDGNRMTVTASGAVQSGDVDVIGTGLLGVAVISGVSGDSIPYALEGVYLIPKVSGAVIQQGEQVLWDVSANAADDENATPAAGDFLCGYAVEARGNGDTTVPVKINRPAPSVT